VSGVRVLVASHEATRTGAPRVALQVASVLGDAGDVVDLVFRAGGPLRREAPSAVSGVLDEPGRRLRAVLTRAGAPASWSAGVGERGAGRVLDRVRPDLVWANTVVSVPYVLAAAERGVPVVLHAHEPERLMRRTLERARLADRLGPAASGVTLVGCATDVAERLAALVPAAGPPAVVHSATDVAGLRARAGRGGTASGDGPPVVLAVGLANAGKGFDVFVDAARAALAAGSDARWRWVGEVAPELDAGPVETPGSVPDAAREIAAASVVVLPSRADSFPLVVLEAMALGRPVVATRLAGPIEQLGEDGAVWAEPGDPGGLAEGVAALLADPARAHDLGAAAAQRCEERWDVAAFRRRVLEVRELALSR